MVLSVFDVQVALCIFFAGIVITLLPSTNLPHLQLYSCEPSKTEDLFLKAPLGSQPSPAQNSHSIVKGEINMCSELIK